jgi:hypothetical protein
MFRICKTQRVQADIVDDVEAFIYRIYVDQDVITIEIVKVRVSFIDDVVIDICDLGHFVKRVYKDVTDVEIIIRALRV